MNSTLWDNPGSFWLAEDYTPNPPLTGQIQADVAIIGGGITGLSSAYHLKRRYPEKQIVLLEGQAVGFGASGRNSGFISREYHRAFTPLLGRAGKENNILYSVGYNGFG